MRVHFQGSVFQMMHLIKFKFRKIDNVPLIMQIPRICQNKVKRNTTATDAFQIEIAE